MTTLVEKLQIANARLEQLRYQTQEQIKKIVELQQDRLKCSHQYNSRGDCELCGLNEHYVKHL